MISSLHIQNIALIRDLTLDLHPGLTILSGETGAGKSIIIDSINFVLGDRADRSLIRYGETTARVELVFDDLDNYDEIKTALEEVGVECEDETVIVSRFMTAEKSECRINGRIVTLSVLRRIVASLVDIHSQNEHQSLMKSANHIGLLDAFNDQIQFEKEKYRKHLAEYKVLLAKREGFLSQDERERRIDNLRYQIDEIERINWIDPEEEERVKNVRTKYYNAQKIIDGLSTAAESIGDDNMGALYAIKNALNDLRGAQKYDESLDELYERLESLSIEAQDIYDTLREKLDESGEYVDIEAIESRLNEIRSVKKKYGATTEEVEKYLENAKKECDELENAEVEIAKVEKKIAEIEGVLLDLTKKLHGLRVKTAEKFDRSICENLRELGMKNSVFESKIDYDDTLDGLNANGADTVEFLLSPNLGEPLKPLAKIASGGEASRFMLALKNIISEVDKIGTLIFDEIDTGISGVIAKVVAKKLYDIAKLRQVIAITHLPQLASMADYNYLIEKKVVDDKTLTFVKSLTGDEVYEEIMRLTGAVENSAVGLTGAKELKDWANAYKNK